MIKASFYEAGSPIVFSGWVVHLIILENNKKEIEIARQNTLNNMHTLLKKYQ
jgi:hypothetical protein